MRTLRRLAFVVAVILAFTAVPARAQAPRDCQPLAGSLAASVGLVNPTDPPEQWNFAWMGKGFLSFANAAPPAVASLLDTNDGYKESTNPKGLWGSEILEFTFDQGGDKLVMRVDYSAIISFSTSMGQYNAAGRITGGTGRYANASGTVTVHGPFIADDNVPFTSWIAALKGTLCGAQ